MSSNFNFQPSSSPHKLTSPHNIPPHTVLTHINQQLNATKMLTSKSPTLRTRRPSPTTIEYTVSTSPVTLTLPLRALFLLSFLIRISVGAATILVLYAKYLLSAYAMRSLNKVIDQPERICSVQEVLFLLRTVMDSRPGQLATTLATRVPFYILTPLALGILYLTLSRPHTTESLLVLRGLGIQTSSSSSTYLSSDTTRFIPTEKIQDILVNEAFRGFEVRYYLGVVVEGEREVVIVFPGLLPRREIVEGVWRGVRGCLWEGKERA
ncbi:GPI-GlcNAc transferase complex, PIG-H component-domain-containing protein [Halenospora varia]|nr:GPI-GlcNAc transferase complex, PIG-H component-domain-containing protein [Halenospora varia]